MPTLNNRSYARQFFVSYGSAMSALYSIHAGVPQGSVLGPRLVLLYTMDIPTTSNTINSLFADDTSVTPCHFNYKKAVSNLQKLLNSIATWSTQWKIKLNQTK